MMIKVVMGAGAALVLAGCVGLQLDRATGVEPSGSDFTQELYAGYIARSQSEFAEADYADSDAFALRAQQAAAGENVIPEEISARGLPAEQEPELIESRGRLMAALDGGGRDRFAVLAASAQVNFDCWMQEQEENFQPDDIAACRGDFSNALAELETALAPPVVVEAEPLPALEPRTFVVFFDFDDASLSDSASSKLADAKAYADELTSVSIMVEGHADRAGPDQYNDGLAQIRAQLVADALRDRGFDSGSIEVVQFGEARSAVETPDGTPEPMNRRVEITVTPK